MDVGVISTRYAKAIFQYALERGTEAELYENMKMLAVQFNAVPLLKKVLENPTVSSSDKIKVLITAAGGEVSNTYEHVVRMVIDNGRGRYMQSIALMYDKVYRKEKGMIRVKLTTTALASEEMKKDLVDIIIRDKNEKVDFDTIIDPDILGGFILEIGDSRLNASVKNQLNQMRLDLTKN